MIFLRVEILIRNDPDLAVTQYSVNCIYYFHIVQLSQKMVIFFFLIAVVYLKKLLNQTSFTYVFRSTLTSARTLKIPCKM